ncbi:DUF1189 family protein [bacterium]|nr:DUF1189 family protein [bacterium]
MEKEKTPFLRSIIFCFNPNFYPAVLRQNGWRSFLYLGLICLMVYGVLGYRRATVRFDLYAEGASDFYEKVLPDFYFENGQADYPPDTPHVYEEREDGKVFAVVVDTSGNTKGLEEDYDAGLLITRTEIVTKGLKGEEKRQAIPKTEKKVPADEFFKSLVREQRPKAVLAESFNVYLFQVIGKVILVSLVSGAFLLADKGKTQPYPFAYYFNVGCYAVTPFVIAGFARWGLSGSIVTWASYGVSLMLFLALALSGLAKCRQEDARELQSARPSRNGELLQEE